MTSDGVRRLVGRLEWFLRQEGGREREREREGGRKAGGGERKGRDRWREREKREREREERVDTDVFIQRQCWGVCSMHELLGGGEEK